MAHRMKLRLAPLYPPFTFVSILHKQGRFDRWPTEWNSAWCLSTPHLLLFLYSINRGGLIDGPQNGTPPGAWDLPFHSTGLFKKETYFREVRLINDDSRCDMISTWCSKVNVSAYMLHETQVAYIISYILALNMLIFRFLTLVQSTLASDATLLES